MTRDEVQKAIPCRKVTGWWIAYLWRNGAPFRLMAKSKREAVAKAMVEIDKAVEAGTLDLASLQIE